MNNCNGQKLNVMAVSLANALSDGLSVTELAVMSNFFNMVSDALDMIASTKATQEELENFQNITTEERNR